MSTLILSDSDKVVEKCSWELIPSIGCEPRYDVCERGERWTCMVSELAHLTPAKIDGPILNVHQAVKNCFP